MSLVAVRESTMEQRITTAIYLQQVRQSNQELRPIRSEATHTLLAYESHDGLLLWDRRSNSQHVLTWETVLEMLKRHELPEA